MVVVVVVVGCGGVEGEGGDGDVERCRTSNGIMRNRLEWFKSLVVGLVNCVFTLGRLYTPLLSYFIPGLAPVVPCTGVTQLWFVCLLFSCNGDVTP